MASIMELPSVSYNVLGPLFSPEIVLVKVALQDAKKDVVVNPLGNGTDVTGSHDLGLCFLDIAYCSLQTQGEAPYGESND